VWSLFPKHNLGAKMPPRRGRVVLLDERDELEKRYISPSVTIYVARYSSKKA
jgi:hypothetical protein